MNFLSVFFALCLASVVLSAALEPKTGSFVLTDRRELDGLFDGYLKDEGAKIFLSDSQSTAVKPSLPDTLSAVSRQSVCGLSRLRIAQLSRGPFRIFPSSFCLEDYPSGFRVRVNGRAVTVSIFSSFGNVLSTSRPHGITVFYGNVTPGAYYFAAADPCGNFIVQAFLIEQCVAVETASA